MAAKARSPLFFSLVRGTDSKLESPDLSDLDCVGECSSSDKYCGDLKTNTKL